MTSMDETLGAAFAGLVVAATLHGVSIIQALYYYTHQNDLWPTKLLVGAVMTFDTIHQVLITHTVYWYCVASWGNPTALQLIVWSMRAQVIFSGLTALLVQSFLTMRVWRMSEKNKLLTGAVVLLVLGELAVVITYECLTSKLKNYAELAEVKYLSILINGLAAAGDVLIAGALCTLLHLSRTGFRKSDTMINRLILFSVNTGVLTSVCALGSLISILVAGQTFIYIAFFFCIGRLYTNSLLATLNARESIRKVGSATTPSDASFSMSKLAKTTVGTRRPTDISIKIDTMTDFGADQKLNYRDLDRTDLETASSSAQFFEKGKAVASVAP